MRLSLERFVSFLTVLLAAFAMAQLAGAAPLPDSRTEGPQVARQQSCADRRDVLERYPTFRAGPGQSLPGAIAGAGDEFAAQLPVDRSPRVTAAAMP